MGRARHALCDRRARVAVERRRRGWRRAAQEALRLDPTLGEARTALGKLHVRQWRWKEAEREARRALETSPDDATARQWLGTLLLRLGRCDEALEQVQAGVRIDPLAPIVNEALGSVYLGCGRPARAIEPIRMVVAMYPDIARSRRQLGTVHARVGNFSAGLPELRESVRLDPDDCLNQASLAQALGASGARVEARAIVTKLEREKDTSPVSPVLPRNWLRRSRRPRPCLRQPRARVRPARFAARPAACRMAARSVPQRSAVCGASWQGRTSSVHDHCGRCGTRAFVQGARRSGPSRNSGVIPAHTACKFLQLGGRPGPRGGLAVAHATGDARGCDEEGPPSSVAPQQPESGAAKRDQRIHPGGAPGGSVSRRSATVSRGAA